MKKICKILTIILLVVMMVSFTNSVVFADAFSDLQNASSNAANNTNAAQSSLIAKAGKIMNMIRNIAIIASVIIIMILGVKYMLGSIEEKAEYKKSFMPLIIGIILVVAASTIASFIFNMV